MDEFKNFLINLSNFDLEEYINFHLYYNYLSVSDDNSINESWKYFIQNYTEEDLLLLLSYFPNDKITPKIIDDVANGPISCLTIMDMEKDGLKFNRKSKLLQVFPEDSEYLKFINNEQLDNKYFSKFNYNSEINNILSKINFELENLDLFVFRENKEVDNYGRKHYKIKKFFELWNLYKNIKSNKKEFFDNEIYELAKYLNWKTVSRLYDINDKEFIELFDNWIDKDFANEYHPDLKNIEK